VRLSNYFHDFRELARRRLPGPIFNYIDGAADDGDRPERRYAEHGSEFRSRGTDSPLSVMMEQALAR
jgi:hypothetical protein